jgi:uncharacterized small protein (DUF1192 family)
MDAKTEATVNEALALYVQIGELSKRLGVLKDALRTKAEKMDRKAGGEGDKIELATEAGVAEIVFVRDKPTIRRGGNPRALLETLGEETWFHLFELRPGIKEDFAPALELLPKGQKSAVLDHVEMRPQDPRVTLVPSKVSP